MKRHPLVWHVFLALAAAVTLTTAVVAWCAARALHTLTPPPATAVHTLYLRILGVWVLLVSVAGCVSALVARRIARPLQALRRNVIAVPAGTPWARLPDSRVAEIDLLANALAELIEHLDDHVRGVTRERDEQVALLACMVEGVLAVDTDRRLISANRAAMPLLRVGPSDMRGRRIEEIVRSADLLAIIEQTFNSSDPVEDEILLPGGERHLQVHGTVLRGAGSVRSGALIVIDDITQRQRLESVRTDFVANVSHELKTPITSIKGFTETLLDGADEQGPERRRFLEIIRRQSDRLQMIVEDLLSLSSIEHATKNQTIRLQTGRLDLVLDNVVQTCQAAARNRGMRINVSCPEPLHARFDVHLLEQAVGNLIDNAIKYGDPDTEVNVRAQEEGREIAIQVQDSGPGIPNKHLPHLCERFYRVDKGRSRKLGGTGLGLAIVRQIALAHHGRVTVESRVAEGTTFALHLPRGPSEPAPGAATASSGPDA